MATVNTEVLKAIGALQEAVKNLIAQAERLDDRAQEHRDSIYEMIEALREEVSKLTSDVRVQEDRLAKLEPVVGALNASHERSVGAKGLGKFIWTVIIALVSLAVTAANQLLTYFHHNPPPLTH